MRPRSEIYADAARKWGISSQEDVLLEEMAELAQTIIRMRRKKIHSYVQYSPEDLAEEAADVMIMLEQLIQHHGLDDSFSKWKIFKLERLENRLKENDS